MMHIIIHNHDTLDAIIGLRVTRPDGDIAEQAKARQQKTPTEFRQGWFRLRIYYYEGLT